MIAGSLFSGIEGFGLGLIWSGLVERIAFQVEIDPFCRRVLEARFPNVDRSITDVRAASASVLSAVELLFGGFPCQDVSGAGKGAGLDGERSGLWREFRRIVDEMRPRAVLVENVASGARRWVCAVRSDLRALGYRTSALNIGVDDCGGPHRRKRIFVLAHTERVRELQSGGSEPSERRRTVYGGPEVANAPSGVRLGEASREAGHAALGREGLADSERGGWDERTGTRKELSGLAKSSDRNHMADAASHGFQGSEFAISRKGASDVGRRFANAGTARIVDDRSAQPAMGSRSDGLPARVVRWPARRGEDQESWEPPRVLASVEERAAKLKAIGNAVSPIQAYHVGRWAREVLRV